MNYQKSLPPNPTSKSYILDLDPTCIAKLSWRRKQDVCATSSQSMYNKHLVCYSA